MDMNGDWRLSPAYDLTYARGGGFTRTHQMTFADKDTGITIDDILSVGRQFGIKKHGQDVINDVIEGLSQWRTLAKDAGVPIKRIDQIESEYAKPAQH
jgi:serine/threonine-protein kinase HipA